DQQHVQRGTDGRRLARQVTSTCVAATLSNAAPDIRLSSPPAGHPAPPIKGDPPSHLSQRRYSVAGAKRFPSQRSWQDVGACENPATDNEVSRSMELKQEQIAGPQRLAVFGLPEVDFTLACSGATSVTAL